MDRILRVRTLQLGQVRSQEMAAREKVAQEEALRARIAQLAANVAPTEAQEMATSLKAAAHYRERLHQSAIAADKRVEMAEKGLTFAEEATREAKRDQCAVEKLLVRSHAAAALKEMRALEELPPQTRKRHDLC